MASLQSRPEIRLALPGKGALETATSAFLAECGMKVSRNNPRQYLARIRSLPEIEVVFQRAADIPELVQDGDAILGITGYDILAEHRGFDEAESPEDDGDDDLIVIERNLGYGACQLVVAVPETWIDVNTCADLWHLAGYYQSHKGRGLRIATKYPLLTTQFLRKQGITHCKIISPHGALEAAPLTGTADLIVDLTETGTTLRENRLKLLEDGTVLRSQACLIANKSALRDKPEALKMAKTMLELMEARTQARNRSMLTASMHTESLDAIQLVCEQLNRRLQSLVSGFSFRVTAVEPEEGINRGDYTISGMVNAGGDAASELLEIVAALRSAGARHIDVTPLTFRFGEEATSVRVLHERLKRR